MTKKIPALFYNIFLFSKAWPNLQFINDMSFLVSNSGDLTFSFVKNFISYI